MDNIYEYLKRKSNIKASGFETADFYSLGFNSPPSDNEIETAIQKVMNAIKHIEENNIQSCGHGANKQAFTTPILPNKVIFKINRLYGSQTIKGIL